MPFDIFFLGSCVGDPAFLPWQKLSHQNDQTVNDSLMKEIR